jgi:hypothetical protein
MWTDLGLSRTNIRFVTKILPSRLITSFMVEGKLVMRPHGDGFWGENLQVSPKFQPEPES